MLHRHFNKVTTFPFQHCTHVWSILGFQLRWLAKEIKVLASFSSLVDLCHKNQLKHAVQYRFGNWHFRQQKWKSIPIEVEAHFTASVQRNEENVIEVMRLYLINFKWFLFAVPSGLYRTYESHSSFAFYDVHEESPSNAEAVASGNVNQGWQQLKLLIIQENFLLERIKLLPTFAATKFFALWIIHFSSIADRLKNLHVWIK